mgnify:CR=1 FL=1
MIFGLIRILKGMDNKMKALKSINIGEDICIDPGSDFVSVYISGKGIVLREASVVAYNKKTREIIAVGDEAAETEGKAPSAIATERPIKGGAITDTELTGELISRLLAKVRTNGLVKPRIMVSVPCGISDVEERALTSAVMKAGARQVLITEAPVAAALGAGCDVTIARGLMVLDIGGGKTDMAVVSLCRCVEQRLIKTAGNDFTDAVTAFMQKRHSLNIGKRTAQKLKESICSADDSLHAEAEVYGTDTTTHLPRKVKVHSSETAGIFDSCINKTVTLIKDTLDAVPPEILADILEDGILAVGGGAKLPGLIPLLSSLCGIKIFPAEDIDLCSIKGLGIAVENLSSLTGIAKSYHNL